MARKKNRITNKRECKIETYKTRAEMIAENPIRDGDDEFLNSAQVCAILGISSSTLSRYNRKKSIRFTMLSQSNYRYRKSDVEAYMVSRQIDQRRVDRRKDNIGSPIQRRTGDRRRVDRVKL
jgi:excisionase family DNA binding protein